MSQQITPSRMTLALFKQKTISARKGHELLKKKCDCLKTRFRSIMVALLDNKMKMDEEMQKAFLLFAEAQWAAGQFNSIVKDSIKKAFIRVDISTENIAGVMLPNLNLKELEDSEGNLSQLGLDKGGLAIQRTRQKFKECLYLLVKVASLQTSFVTLDEVIKVTNRRVNALEHVVIPEYMRIQVYINQELDEMAREDLFRIKKVLDNKRKVIAEEDAEVAKYEAMMAAKGVKAQGGGNLIDQDDKIQDEDIVF
ncbi:vacuolar ATP synthase subunit d, putative [Ichthyophthirius multifiliis]|uniref:Vacuolar ATP synthase subunit d, putative n=1 Tax=Ichthyophthirius multifiliis TaxID=5932 RepID=G0R4R2_ICHMU|nr:vacuolar ATP synthase subunit d, putative [Ichthyophthirius multifiliis]EGR27568.1 vacuolar ATP synthase subunit d, putative [Ichthyophthirius multifiliis]|eukprot:XP_004025020.1 vacuolar ATP synthase subunit d, putative [Ichthyophthirius multifiliis]